jgi:glutathione S-transferase
VFGASIDQVGAQQLTRGLFAVLESELSKRDYLLERGVSIADIALYTYTAHAPEGGFSLEPYPCVAAWLRRVEALPGFVGMTRSPVASLGET